MNTPFLRRTFAWVCGLSVCAAAAGCDYTSYCKLADKFCVRTEPRVMQPVGRETAAKFLIENVHVHPSQVLNITVSWKQSSDVSELLSTEQMDEQRLLTSIPAQRRAIWGCTELAAGAELDVRIGKPDPFPSTPAQVVLSSTTPELVAVSSSYAAQDCFRTADLSLPTLSPASLVEPTTSARHDYLFVDAAFNNFGSPFASTPVRIESSFQASALLAVKEMFVLGQDVLSGKLLVLDWSNASNSQLPVLRCAPGVPPALNTNCRWNSANVDTKELSGLFSAAGGALRDQLVLQSALDATGSLLVLLLKDRTGGPTSGMQRLHVLQLDWSGTRAPEELWPAPSVGPDVQKIFAVAVGKLEDRAQDSVNLLLLATSPTNPSLPEAWVYRLQGGSLAPATEVQTALKQALAAVRLGPRPVATLADVNQDGRADLAIVGRNPSSGEPQPFLFVSHAEDRGYGDFSCRLPRPTATGPVVALTSHVLSADAPAALLMATIAQPSPCTSPQVGTVHIEVQHAR